MQQKSFTAGTKDGAEHGANLWVASQRTIENVELRTSLRRAGMKEKLQREGDLWTCVVRYDTGKPGR